MDMHRNVRFKELNVLINPWIMRGAPLATTTATTTPISSTLVYHRCGLGEVESEVGWVIENNIGRDERMMKPISGSVEHGMK